MYHPFIGPDFGTPWLVWDLFWDVICAGILYSVGYGVWTTLSGWFI